MSLQEAECEDARIEYLANITKLTLDIDPGLWAEMMWKEDNQMIVKDFLDTPATKLLFICLGVTGKLSVAIDFPKARPLPVKSVYFLKYTETSIPLTNFKKHFMRGTLSKLPLMQYQVIYEQVVVPILCNPVNNVKWPAEVTEDIISHIQEFRNVLHYCLGQARGRTLLPVPDVAKNVNLLNIDSLTSESTGDENMRSLLNSIGAMVDNWTILANEVLKAECEQLASDPAMYGPTSEIVYWKDRKENLKFIFRQMDDPIVKHMAKVLEKVNSCYVQAFKKLLRDVVEALTEAEDISSHMEDLESSFELLNDCEFPDMLSILPEVMMKITASWKESKYFRSSPSRIAVLVQKICNLLIKRAHSFLNGTTLFTDDRATSKERIIVTRNIVDQFVESYYKCQTDMESTFEHAKLYPWEFPDERVFKCLKNFYQRIKIIQELFEAADTFHLISKFELKGLQQTVLKLQLDGIFNEFCEIYKLFEEASYDPLDFENKAFETDYQIFSLKISDLDCRLGAAISKGCLECSSTKQAFQLMTDLRDLIQRTRVEAEFKSCVPSLISKVNTELSVARSMYNDLKKSLLSKGYCFIYQNMPPVSSIICWALELKEKMTSSINSLKSIENYFITSKDADMEYQEYEKLIELLTTFETSTFEKWTHLAETAINKKLNQPVLVKDDKGKYILNYDLQVSEIISEVKILRKISQLDIPQNILTLSERDEILHYAHSFMFSTVGWYSDLDENMVPFERSLIAEQWDNITKMLDKGLGVQWSSSDLREYAESVYTFTKAIFTNMNKTKENVNEVKKMIESWSSYIMYARETPTASVDFRVYMNPQVRKQYNNIKMTDMKMREKMEMNLELFKCDPGSECWKEYITYLESILEQGLQNAAMCNLKYLLENTDSQNTKLAPFIVIQLQLDEGFVFIPPVVTREPCSLTKCFEGVIEKIVSMGAQVKRMTDEKNDYEKALQKLDALSHLKTTIIQHVVQATGKAQLCTQKLLSFEDFWLTEIDTMLDDFVTYGPASVYDIDEEDEEFDEDDLKDVAPTTPVPQPPTEEEFKAQIAHFEMLYEQADNLEQTIPVESWLVIDTSSFKESLLALIRQWITAYKQKLIEQKSLGKLRKIVSEDID